MADEKWWLVRGKQVLAILRPDGRSLFATDRACEGASVTTPAFEGLRLAFEEELSLWDCFGDEFANQRWFELWDWLRRPGLALESGTSGERLAIYWIHFKNCRAWWLPLNGPAPIPAPESRPRPGRIIEEQLPWPLPGGGTAAQRRPPPQKPKAGSAHPLAPIKDFYKRTQAVAGGDLAMAGAWSDSIRGLRPKTVRVLEVVFNNQHEQFRDRILRDPHWPWLDGLPAFPPDDIRALAEAAVRFLDAICAAEGLALTGDGEDPRLIEDEAEWVWDRDNPTGPILRRKP